MKAIARFNADWTERLDGDLAQAGELAVDYDLSRLPQIRIHHREAAVWDIVAHVRFHPDAQIRAASVTRPVNANPGGATIDRAPAVATFPVPGDAVEVELWFLNIGYGPDPPAAWDSRYGQNYRFAVRNTSPAQPVARRPDVQTAPEVVNAFQLVAEKQRHRFSAPGGSELRVVVRLVAWVRNLTYTKNVWFDANVFDGDDRLIHAQTVPVHYKEGGGGGGDLFEFDGVLYTGSRGQPGSVSPRPDARRVQLRLYCEMNGRLYTDGILHDHPLTEDGAVH
jgi:hypothetical protein